MGCSAVQWDKSGEVATQALRKILFASLGSAYSGLKSGATMSAAVDREGLSCAAGTASPQRKNPTKSFSAEDQKTSTPSKALTNLLVIFTATVDRWKRTPSADTQISGWMTSSFRQALYRFGQVKTLILSSAGTP